MQNQEEEKETGSLGDRYVKKLSEKTKLTIWPEYTKNTKDVLRATLWATLSAG
jgi:hypothetical protein